jgi:hypothetical protein
MGILRIVGELGIYEELIQCVIGMSNFDNFRQRLSDFEQNLAKTRILRDGKTISNSETES